MNHCILCNKSVEGENLVCVECSDNIQILKTGTLRRGWWTKITPPWLGVTGEKHPFYGKHHTKEWKAEHSKSMTGDKNPSKRPEEREKKRGDKNPFYGKHHSKKTLKKMSGAHNTPEALAKAREDGKKSMKTLRNTPSSLEFYLMAIIQKYELSIQYTGNANYEFKLGYCTPDFISMTKKDFVIDIFGDHWHGEEETGRTKEQEEQKYREHYKKYNYEWYPLWENEIYSMSEDELYNWLTSKI